MSLIKERDGFSLVEIVVVVGVMAFLVSIAGSMSAKFAERRSVDRITATISSTLQITKLRALRHGLEHQAIFDFDPLEKTLTIVTERGNSNRGSDEYTEETSQILRLKDALTITPATRTYNFNPNGTLGGASGTITISPANSANIKRCGRIVVSPFGRVRVIQGNWNQAASVCNPVK